MQNQQPTQQPALKIIGYIKDVKPWRRSEPNQFIIGTVKSGDFHCSAPINMFCNVQPGDSIEAYVQISGNPELRQLFLTRQPFIQFPVDEQNIKECFIRALRGTGFGAILATELYKHLYELAKKFGYSKPKGLNPTPPIILPSELLTDRDEKTQPQKIESMPVIEGIPKKTIAQEVGITDEPVYKPTELVTGPDGVIAVLSELAGAYATTQSETSVSSLMSGTRLQVQQAKDLLRWWHNQRSLRRLYLLGLTKTEIRKAGTNLDQLYDECLTNPYKVCSIPIDKCNNLMLSIGKTPKPDDVRAGEIVRKVHFYQENCGHTCTPYYLLKKHFIDLPDYKMYIEQEFKVKYEFDAVYTKYAHRVESMMALYFNELIKRTATRLNALPEIDTPIMESALFECKTLDNEQKLAIQGALSHHICIIQGGAGTGKCTSFDTSILMYNGDVKLAMNVKKNDLLMGPDSKPRTVLSTCTGNDEMYEIIPTIGKSFTCNTPHILTLREKVGVPKLIHSNIQFTNTPVLVNSSLIGKLMAQYVQCPFSPSFYWMSIDRLFHEQTDLLYHGHYFSKLLNDIYVAFTKHQIYSAYKYAPVEILQRFLLAFVTQFRSLTETGISIIITSKQLVADLDFIGHRLNLIVDIDSTTHGSCSRYEIHMHGSSLKDIFSSSFSDKALQVKSPSQRFRVFPEEKIPDISPETFDIPLNEYLLFPDNIKSKLYLYHQGVDFPEISVPIHPAKLGSLLRKYNWAINCLDLIASFEKYAAIVQLPDIDLKALKVLSKVGEIHPSAMFDGKSIPREYKVNSRQNRIQLLNGYFQNTIENNDSPLDGINICEYNLSLGDDIEYVALSIGLMVDKKKVVEPETYYQFKFYGSVLNELTIIPKDVDDGLHVSNHAVHHQTTFTTQSISTESTFQLFTVKHLGQGKYCGWTLDSDGRFLLDDFLVTHNTMSIREIVKNLELREMSYAACSFTGKAVSRIADVLKRRCAMTMDRMIAQPGGNKEGFVYCIVDEFSMVTLELMYRFVRAHPWDVRFIFIGDIGQLQPIGWGSVMQALIDCQRVPVYTLNINHRIIKHELDSAAEKQIGADKAPGDVEFDRVILENANLLIDPDRDLKEPVTFREGTGFYIYYGGTSYVTTIIKSLAEAGIDQSRVQILCPYTEPLKNLNVMAQSIFLPNAKAIMDPKQRIWKVNDPVMMTHNNYTINVMNGETGKVTDVSNSNIKVMFSDGAEHTFKFRSDDPFQDKVTETGDAVDSGPTEYEGEELLVKHLVHSYAISVHKSQGSEFEFVIFFLPPHPSNKLTSFINRNLVYTAWTRTKRSIWTITDKFVFDHACATNPAGRHEYLCRRLYQSRDKELETKMEAITKPKPKVITEKAAPNIDTSYDFGHDDDDSMYEQHYRD